MKRLIGSGGLYVLATVAPIVTLLAVTPFVTRLLGAEQYSEVAVAITVYQFSSAVLTLGLPAAITRNAILEEGGFAHASGAVLTGAAVSVVVATATCLSIPLWAAAAFPGVDQAVILWGIIAGFGLGVITMGQALFRADDKVFTFVGIAAAAALTPPVLGILFIRFGSDSAETYSLGLGAGYVFIAIVSVLLVVRHTRPQLHTAALLQALRIGLPTLPHLASVPLLLTIALSIVIANNGLRLAGELQIAVVLGSAIVTILNALNNAWSPMIMRASSDDRPDLLERSTLGVAAVAFALFAGFSLVAPVLVPFIGGPSGAAPSVTRAAVVVATGGMLHVLYLANIHLTFISGRTQPLALSTPLSAFISLTVLWSISSANSSWDGIIILFAVTWPLFYALQAIASWLLARRSGYAPVRVRWSVLPIASGVLLGGVFLVPLWQPWLSWVSAVVLLTLNGLIIAKCFRRPKAV